jgi:hypothetical protein
MVSDAPSKGARRCTHCGREVTETVHTRGGYRVDYYALHTGTTEPATMARSDDTLVVTVLKLLEPIEVVTCADCYHEPRVRAERELLFRPESSQPSAVSLQLGRTK